MTPKLIKSYNAATDTPGRVIARFTTDEGDVGAATSASDRIIGVVDEYGSKAAQPLDVIQGGLADVIAGGDVDAGEFVTADASGHAVVAEPGAGITHRVVGIAMGDAVSGDIFQVLVNPAPFTGAA